MGKIITVDQVLFQAFMLQFCEGDPQTVQWLINNGGQDVKECLRK